MASTAGEALSIWHSSCLFFSFLSFLFPLYFCLSVDSLRFSLLMEPGSWPAKHCDVPLTNCGQPLALEFDPGPEWPTWLDGQPNSVVTTRFSQGPVCVCVIPDIGKEVNLKSHYQAFGLL